MNSPQFYNEIKFLFNLLLIVSFWFFIWKRFALDWFRQRLFDIRGELFDAILRFDAKEIESESYQIFRNVINATIRFAHTYSPIRFLILKRLIFRRFDYSNQISGINQKLSFSDIENKFLKNQLIQLRNEYLKTIVVYFAISSVFFWFYSLILILNAIIKTLISYFTGKKGNVDLRIKKAFKEQLKEIPFQAIEEARLAYSS